MRNFLLAMTCLVFVAQTLSDEHRLADQLTNRLVDAGFENVSVLMTSDRTIVTYENRIYRDEIRGIMAVMELLNPEIETGYLTLIPQHRQTPLVAMTVPYEAFLAFSEGEMGNREFAEAVDVSLEVDPILKKTNAARRTNTSHFRFDLVVHPQFNARFGNFADAIESQINIAPEIQATLWRGMSLSGQLIVPIQNDLGAAEDDLRPGLLTANQTLRLPHQTFVSTTLGYFSRDRYGINLEIAKFLANGRWTFGTDVGYTAHATYQDGTWFYANLGILTPLFYAQYWVPQFDLSLRATVGRFLFEDMGARFDVRRQFDEIEIGFFALKTEAGTNGGFNFSIPLFPPKYLMPRRLRISPAKSFEWEYRYREVPNGGLQYRTGNDLDRFMKRLNPDYVKHRIAEWDNDRWAKHGLWEFVSYSSCEFAVSKGPLNHSPVPRGFSRFPPHKSLQMVRFP